MAPCPPLRKEREGVGHPFLSRLRGFPRFSSFPTAYAVGFILSPLRGFLPSYAGRRDVVFDNAVEVEAAALLERGGGAVLEEVPGFAVGFPLVLFVAGAGADGESAGGLS